MVAIRRLRVEGDDLDAADAGKEQLVAEGRAGGKPTERPPEALDFQAAVAASEGVVP